ncbi:unnamed protein product [Parnassius apollo]|uniref:(apollo) hypothetical protein n=1 Tax=Parnassius apollo TaxID=110799 RepID=A0A8S3W7L7_PARAO|nr:unnamed protein product [Parnassius apollo]
MAPPQRKRSLIWNHFSTVGNGRAICSLCQKTLSYFGGATGNLLRHMKLKHKVDPLERVTYTPVEPTTVSKLTQGRKSTVLNLKLASAQHCKDPLLQIKAEPTLKLKGTLPTVRGPITIVYSKQQLDEQLTKAIVKEHYPFSIVEGKEFRKFISMLRPAYSMPTEKTITNVLIPRLYNETKQKVEETLSSVEAACLTTDSWTTSDQNYVSITAHFICEIDGKSSQRSCLLGCIPYDNSYTAQKLGMFLAEEVEKWGMQDKVICVVTDNTPNIVAAVRNNNWRHIPCFAHTLNLVLGDGLQIIQAELSKIKDIVLYFKRNSNALLKLTNIQKQLNLPDIKLKQDCITRWNSTFDMLSSVLKIREAVISVLTTDNPDLNCLSSSEWRMLEKAANVLEIFKVIIEEISAEKYVTLSKLMLLIKAINKHLIRASEEFVIDQNLTKLVQELQTSMSLRFFEMDTQDLVTQATFIDPRFKKYGFPDTVKYERCVNSLKHEILATPSLCSDIQDPLPSTSSTIDLQLSNTSLLWDDFDKQVEYVICDQDPQTASHKEIEKYINEPLINRLDDPLMWWDENKHIYPRLFKLMKSRLCIVATSVSCDRIFTKEGLIINNRRSFIKPNETELCVFLNYNL